MGINRSGYRIIDYGDMITDKERIEPYLKALQQAMSPGCVVIDIGAGTGFFSLMSCQFKVGHVHCVEPDNAIRVAQEIAIKNGYADKITFHQNLSTEVVLPSPGDVIISDLRGTLPLYQHHIPAIIDARKRLLKPSGCLIPQADTLWATPVEAPKTYKPYKEPWVYNDHSLDMRAGHKLVVNNWCKVDLKLKQLLATPQCWATLDYTTIKAPDIEGRPSWTVERPGIVHGLAVWFDTNLGNGIGFSNAPGKPKLVYSQTFFPLQEPVSVEPGDIIDTKLQANLVGDDYLWRWSTKIYAQDNTNHIKAKFQQSTFFGTPISPLRLRKRASYFTPKLNVDGKKIYYVLDLMNNDKSLKSISNKVLDKFPGQFSNLQEALTYVSDLSEKYG